MFIQHLLSRITENMTREKVIKNAQKYDKGWGKYLYNDPAYLEDQYLDVLYSKHDTEP